MSISSEDLFDENPNVAPLRKYLEEVVDQTFLERYGAHAAGIGVRRKGAGKDDPPQLCLVLYVEKKRGVPDKAHDIPNPIHFTDPVTRKSVDIPTDVVESPIAEMDGGGPAPNSPHFMVPGGVSCFVDKNGTIPANTFTLGGWVWDSQDQTVVLLSNVHALGDNASTAIFHPRVLEAPPGHPPARLGQVKRGSTFVPGNNHVDCAIGGIDALERAVFEVREIGPAVMATRSPRPDDTVEKMGIGTGHTHGRIDNPRWKGKIKDLTGQVHFFTECISIESTNEKKWCDNGDSGSLIFADTALADGSGIKPVIALHFGHLDTTMAGRIGVACRIQKVFEALTLTTLPTGVFASLVDELHSLTRLTPTILDFRDALRDSEIGAPILDVLDKHRAEVVVLLIRDRGLKSAAVNLLRVLFDGTENLQDVLGRSVSGAVFAARKFAQVLRPLSENALGDALDKCLDAADKGVSRLAVGGGEPLLGDLLRLRGPSAGGDHGPPRVPAQSLGAALASPPM